MKYFLFLPLCHCPPDHASDVMCFPICPAVIPYKLGNVGVEWGGLCWGGKLGWVGLGWVGLGWVGLGWVGLGWVGLSRVGLG